MRKDRALDDMRPLAIRMDGHPFAEGACLYEQGRTKVWCTASIERKIPAWKAPGQGGWLTAEYAMLPRANRGRSAREAVKGKQSGRTVEISRLIGRSLRAALDLKELEGLTISLDCDLLVSDGGSRCASISGAYLALSRALDKAYEEGLVESPVSLRQLAAISVGLVDGQVLVDLDYEEDFRADVDLNLVMNVDGGIVEIQASSEGRVMEEGELALMVDKAKGAIRQLFVYQDRALAEGLVEDAAQDEAQDSAQDLVRG